MVRGNSKTYCNRCPLGCVMTVATKKNKEVDGHARCADVADSVQDVADSVHEANENTLKSCG